MHFLALFALALSVVSCAAERAREADRPFTAGLASVESLEFEVRRLAPARAWVWVRGTLPDPCSALDSPHIQQTGSTFRIELTTRRPFGATCAQMPMPFERRIPLDVSAQVSGAYVVTVNGVTDNFAVNVLNPGPLY